MCQLEWQASVAPSCWVHHAPEFDAWFLGRTDSLAVRRARGFGWGNLIIRGWPCTVVLKAFPVWDRIDGGRWGRGMTRTWRSSCLLVWVGGKATCSTASPLLESLATHDPSTPSLVLHNRTDLSAWFDGFCVAGHNASAPCSASGFIATVSETV